MPDTAGTPRVQDAPFEALKDAQVVEITRDELAQLKAAAGDAYAHGDTWPGSQAPAPTTGS